MITYGDIKKFFSESRLRLIIAADGETVVHKKRQDKIVAEIPAGGVSTAFDPIARASRAVYIARAKTPEDKQVVDKNNKIVIGTDPETYTLKRVFFSDEEIHNYYLGFSNQTLWPLCHAAFERPLFHKHWFDGFKTVNKKFALSIQEEIKPKSFIWLNDYQLCMIPKFLEKPREIPLALFWHIPWPTWEIFRILPQKKQILESMLKCDFIGFHRGYQMRNFLGNVERELEARIDQETNTIYHNKHVTVVDHLPLGIDTEMISSLTQAYKRKQSLAKSTLAQDPSHKAIIELFDKYTIMLGIDRLDYTKGLLVRLTAIDRFFEKNPSARGKVMYISILAPSRQLIPAYSRLHRKIERMAERINEKYKKGQWQPIKLAFAIFSRDEIIHFYKKARLCLVTPLDDGMNLVSKEFVVVASQFDDPGMLILSQFAGSAIDLTSSLIINPYDTDQLADAIKTGLEMPKKERKDRIKAMREILEEHNLYAWTRAFIRAGQNAVKYNLGSSK